MRKRIISPAAVNALKDALATVYWYKKELRTFLAIALGDDRLIARLNWDDYKRNIVGELIDYLVAREDEYQPLLLQLMVEVCRISDFSHLERLEGGQEKARDARAAVQALAKQCQGHLDLLERQGITEEARRQARERAAREQGMRQALGGLRERFLKLVAAENPQQRGFAFEALVRELFVIFDLDPKASFRITGEQIDGAFTFDGTDYLFEGKWQRELVGAADLDAFAAKVSRRLDNTLGLFLSLNGFSPDGVAAHTSGRRTVILMDGCDLTAVLEERIDLTELLRRKRRHASQTGEVYLPVTRVLS
jgi:hypothetical protein